jgi:hypothetical protein
MAVDPGQEARRIYLDSIKSTDLSFRRIILIVSHQTSLAISLPSLRSGRYLTPALSHRVQRAWESIV